MRHAPTDPQASDPAAGSFLPPAEPPQSIRNSTQPLEEPSLHLRARTASAAFPRQRALSIHLFLCRFARAAMTASAICNCSSPRLMVSTPGGPPEDLPV